MLNIWDKVSGRHTPRFWMGTWLNNRKMATVGYVPNSDIRQLLRGLYPYDYVFNFTALAAGATGYGRIVTSSNFFLCAYVANATQGSINGAGSFRAAFSISGEKPNSAYQPSDDVLNQSNRFGAGTNLSWLRYPFFVKARTPILCVCQNFDVNNANTVQLVLHGYGA